MARILLTCWPFAGHLYPQIAVAHALRKRGHECAFYTGERAAEVLRQEGFRRFPFHEVNEKRVEEILFNSDRGSSHPSGMRKFTSVLESWLLGTISQQVADLQPVLRDWQPDLISTEEQMWAPILVLREKEKCNVALTGSGAGAACLIPGPGAPPFGLGLPKPKNFATRLAARMINQAVRLIARDFPRRASEIRRQFGLPALRSTVLQHFTTVPLYIVPSAPEFDYQRRDLPPSVHYVGPLLWNRPQSLAPPEWLKRLRSDLPWVHATEGTNPIADPLVLRAAAQALGGLPMEVILTCGAQRDPDQIDLGPRAPNIHVARWISHTDLLPKIEVFITNGGAGSVMASIMAGVPVVCIPTEWDKPEVAQRVVEAGVGLRLSPRRCTPDNLRRAVEQISRNPSFRANAIRLRQAFTHLGGAARAAELLEKQANQKQFAG